MQPPNHRLAIVEKRWSALRNRGCGWLRCSTPWSDPHVIERVHAKLISWLKGVGFAPCRSAQVGSLATGAISARSPAARVS